MTTQPGPLVAADETLHHQIIDTFASVGQSDPSWTEKVWAIAHARDGSLQAVFGADIDGLSAGPLHYEVVEPLQSVRCRLEPTEHAAISFDLMWRGLFPAALEEPWP